jgi:hypothetical protein
MMKEKSWTFLAALCAMLVPVLASAGDFKLGGTAVLAADPENPANDVIRIKTDDPLRPFGTVSRIANVKIDKLDNMLEFKSWFKSVPPTDPLFPGKTCFFFTPRLQLAVDVDGDGVSDGNAIGLFGNPDFFFSFCPQDTWLYEDFTGAGDVAITGAVLTTSTGQTTPNEEAEWLLVEFTDDLVKSPLNGIPPCDVTTTSTLLPWSDVENFFKTCFPQQLVCSAALIDDARFYFDTTALLPFQGTAYYDLISGGRATWVDRSDTLGRGFAMGCGRVDHDDDEHEGDKDGDHKVDGDDDRFDKWRHERAASRGYR